MKTSPFTFLLPLSTFHFPLSSFLFPLSTFLFPLVCSCAHRPATDTAQQAVGNPVPVTYIMVCCHEMDRGTKFLAGDSACWSLSSNAHQFAEVKSYLEKSRAKGGATVDYILNTDPDEIRMNTVFFLQEQRKNGVWQ